MFLLMEKGLEDNVDDIEDNAYDDAGDGKTHLKVRRKHRKNCECCPVSQLIVR